MKQHPYTCYHIDPKAFRESGEQIPLDDPVVVISDAETNIDSVQYMRKPFNAPRKPTKVELETLIYEGLNTAQIADRCLATPIRVQSWFQTYKINYKKLAVGRK